MVPGYGYEPSPEYLENSLVPPLDYNGNVEVDVGGFLGPSQGCGDYSVYSGSCSDNSVVSLSEVSNGPVFANSSEYQSGGDSAAVSVSGSNSPGSDSTGQQLVWVKPPHEGDDKPAEGDLADVRKRLEKRKRRNGVKASPVDSSNVNKRTRNTLAARRYRQRRQQEVDVLDNKVKELEDELAKAKLEAQWWQMESKRWKEIADGKSE